MTKSSVGKTSGPADYESAGPGHPASRPRSRARRARSKTAPAACDDHIGLTWDVRTRTWWCSAGCNIGFEDGLFTLERRAVAGRGDSDALDFFTALRDVAHFGLCDQETIAEIALDYEAGRGFAGRHPGGYGGEHGPRTVRPTLPIPEPVKAFVACGQPGEVVAFSMLAHKIPKTALAAAMDRRAIFRFCYRHEPEVRMRALAFLTPRGYDEGDLNNMRAESAAREQRRLRGVA